MSTLLMIPAILLAGFLNMIRDFFDWLRGEA